MNDGASQHAGGGAEVDDMVGASNGLFVVLHHHHGISHIAHADQGVEEPSVVALVQPDGGFVEDVDHAGEFRAHLACQPDTLGFTPREARASAIEGEITEAHRFEEAESGADLLENLAGDLAIRPLEGKPAKERVGFAHGECRDIDNALLAHPDRGAFGAQSPPIA